jgi:uncharacterized protein
VFKRDIFEAVRQRITDKRRFIQVLAGPRQTGKTTLSQQLIEEIGIPSHYASADEPVLKDRIWIDQQWEAARFKAASQKPSQKALLVLDEIQKIPGWSEAVKRLWDQDTREKMQIQVILLGSAPLLGQEGETESLAGRFEIIPITHWSFSEMRQAFGFSVEHYVYYGGYPGAAELINEPERWMRYIMDSLIETTISRDILLMKLVYKPALLRRLFELGCLYSGQVLSYQKMLGQLQETGNTTTLSHYLELLEGAGLLRGVPKYSGARFRRRGSSPKLLVLNTALMSALSHKTFEESIQDTNYWGRLVESAIGAGLANGLKGKDIEMFYWAGRNRELDFVLSRGTNLVAIEVKSGQRKTSLPGIEAFSKQFKVKKKLLVGAQGIPIEEFLLVPPEQWLQ